MPLKRVIATGLTVTSLMVSPAVTREARASIAERVVAVVGDRPILLSELQRRARTWPGGPRGGAALRDALDRMIDERVEELAAEEAHISVTPAEVDKALRDVASLGHDDAATRHGLSEREYREQLRREIRSGKLVQLHVRARAHVTDEDARRAYARWLREDAASTIDVHIIAIRVAPNATARDVAAQRAVAEHIVEQARRGTSFCTLVAQHNPPTSPFHVCRSRGGVPLSALMPEVAQIAAPLRPGETAAPLLFSAGAGDRAFLVVQRAPERPPRPFDDVADLMRERAFVDAVERARKQWLRERRRTVYIDDRL